MILEPQQSHPWQIDLLPGWHALYVQYGDRYYCQLKEAKEASVTIKQVAYA